MGLFRLWNTMPVTKFTKGFVAFLFAIPEVLKTRQELININQPGRTIGFNMVSHWLMWINLCESNVLIVDIFL